MRISLLLLFAVLVPLTLTSVAVAQEDDARTHFMRGETAYNQGDYESAIESWRQAYELDPRPLIQFNLSQAYERLGQLQEAKAALEVYLDNADPNDQHQSDARARLAALRERLQQTGVRIVGAPDGATILIDGEDWGRTPRPDAIRVEPGSHRIVLQRDGYEDFNATVVVPAGQRVEVSAEMTEASGAGAAGGGGAVGSTGGTAPVASSGTSPWPYVLMGAGAALVAGGSVLGLAALGKVDDAFTSNDDDADAARALAAAADVSFLLGVGAAATGAVLLFLDMGQERGPGQTVDVNPLLGPGGAGASATVRF